MQNQRKKIFVFIIGIVVLMAVVLSLPPVWSRVVYHSREVYRTVKYWLQPPSEAVFVPSTSGEDTAFTLVSAAISNATPTPEPTTEPTAELNFPIKNAHIVKGCHDT
jgi:hypothetical protein